MLQHLVGQGREKVVKAWEFFGELLMVPRREIREEKTVPKANDGMIWRGQLSGGGREDEKVVCGREEECVVCGCRCVSVCVSLWCVRSTRGLFWMLGGKRAATGTTGE